MTTQQSQANCVNYMRQSGAYQTAQKLLIERRPTGSTLTTNMACFQKGAHIELSTGQIRRVEDIRTEDFIQSALRSVEFQLLESTVVKIETDAATMSATITFSYNNGRQRIDMPISMGHPLFVYGQGWASCNPKLTKQLYALHCQQLQVGDICISLTQRTPYEPVQRLDQQTNIAAPAAYTANEYSYRMYAEMANMVAAYAANCAQQIYDSAHMHKQ